MRKIYGIPWWVVIAALIPVMLGIWVIMRWILSVADLEYMFCQ